MNFEIFTFLFKILFGLFLVAALVFGFFIAMQFLVASFDAITD